MIVQAMVCAWMVDASVRQAPWVWIAVELFVRLGHRAPPVSTRTAQGIALDLEFASMGRAHAMMITSQMTARYQRSAMMLAMMSAWVTLQVPGASSAKASA
jgi:hypothetical protein